MRGASRGIERNSHDPESCRPMWPALNSRSRAAWRARAPTSRSEREEASAPRGVGAAGARGDAVFGEREEDGGPLGLGGGVEGGGGEAAGEPAPAVAPG